MSEYQFIDHAYESSTGDTVCCMSQTRPAWIRIDTDLLDHPKIQRTIKDGGHAAVLLWIQSLGYSARHLTDGWVPLPLPRQWGFKTRQIQALIDNVLWIPLEITDDGGWLINDYPQYQPTRAQWEAQAERKRNAARARWDHAS